tara:strand:+ start:1614 stop:1970 length:357 start_codon:yes stop_codon:yes gene_type:complete
MGRIPSKKNSRNIFVKGGKIINIPQNKYKEWHEQALWQLKAQRVPQDKIKNLTSMTMTFWKPDKRKIDLTNKAQSIEDLLVDYGFIEDDNCDVVPLLQLKRGGIDKENPRCEIEINYD